MKFLLLCGIVFIILIGIISSFKFLEFFYSCEGTVFLSLISFWVTTIALIISIWTLIVAKSIKKVKMEYASQEQRNQKRVNLNKKIQEIKDAQASGIPVSVDYIRGLRAFILHLDVCEPSLKKKFETEVEKFEKAIFIERSINIEELAVILVEISNIMEQDHAARQ